MALRSDQKIPKIVATFVYASSALTPLGPKTKNELEWTTRTSKHGKQVLCHRTNKNQKNEPGDQWLYGNGNLETQI